MYEPIIRNATLADGIGDPLVKADVAIKEGRIAKIGSVTEPPTSAPGLHTVWVNDVSVDPNGDYTALTPPSQVLTEFSATRSRVGMNH